MKEQPGLLNGFGSTLLMFAVMAACSSSAAEQIGFNDPASLVAIPRPFSGARDTFANFYKERGMLFIDGVNPPDPALGWIRHNHFHLTFEDPEITACVRGNQFLFPARMTANGCVAVASPENEPRRLASMVPGHVIQMTYDPNNDGVPDRFNLISLEVYGASPILNVGTRSAAGISVYNNLSGGFTWFLIDANNLTRATLETPFNAEGPFVVDNIVFEPSSSGAGSAEIAQQSAFSEVTAGEADEVALTRVPPNTLDPILREIESLLPLNFPALAVNDAQVLLRGAGEAAFAVSGTIAAEAPRAPVNHRLGEGVIVTLGGFPQGFREVIPAQLFSCAGKAEEAITCEFTGAPGGITRMRITIAADEVQFQATAEALNLSGIAAGEPVAFSLQVGSELGVATLDPASISFP